MTSLVLIVRHHTKSCDHIVVLQISHKNTAPIALIKNDPSRINDVAPLGFADEVEEGEVVDEVEKVDEVEEDEAVDGGEESGVVDGGDESGVVGVPTVGVPADEDNAAPTALAAAWKAAKELLVPSAPGLTANTIPLPQWLAGVFSPCRQ